MRRPLVWVAVTFLLGIAAQPLLPSLAWWLLTVSALVTCLLALPLLSGSPRLQTAAVVAMLVAIVGLGALRMAAEARLPRDHYRQVVIVGPALVEGVVASDPIWRAGAGHPAGQQLVLAVTAVGPQRAGGSVWLRQTQPAYPLRVGDQIRVRGMIRAPHPAATPGAFDEARWLWLQGVEGVLETGWDDVEWIGPPQGWHRALCALFDAKHRALGLMRQLVDPPTAALLAALLAGDRTTLLRDTTALFTDTGTVHLLSVSGWHVTLIGGLLWGLARAARCPRRPAAVVTMMGLVLYCVLTGAQPPIVRATLTGLVLLVGLCLTRPADPLNSLGLAALLILAAAPRALWDIGFQLSFASVVALLTLAPLGIALGRRLLADRPPLVRGPARGLFDALVVSTAAWLGTWPLVAWHLHRITLVSWLANLLAVPLAALVMVTGLVVLLGAWWHPWLVVPWAGAAQLSVHILLGLLARCAALPGATLPCPGLPWWGLLGWYVGLLAAAQVVSRTDIINNDPRNP